MVPLPKPRKESNVSLEFCLQRRRSIREYRVRPLTVQQISQLLWAAQGITHPRGYRTAPSAGALYPIELFVNAWEVEGLQAGLYWYSPARHELERRSEAVPRKDLALAALDQEAIRLAPAVFVIAAVYRRTTRKYGERGIRYVYMEAGHVAQNLCLQATALNLGTVPIGAFYDNQVKRLLGLKEEDPLYLLPVGYP